MSVGDMVVSTVVGTVVGNDVVGSGVAGTVVGMAAGTSVGTGTTSDELGITTETAGPDEDGPGSKPEPAKAGTTEMQTTIHARIIAVITFLFTIISPGSLIPGQGMPAY
jgi:hypothetical protein